MSWLPGSIRGRLLLGLVLVIVGMNAALLSSSYRASRHEIDELFDAQLAQSARVFTKLLTPVAVGEAESVIQRRWDEAQGQVYAEVDDPYGHEYESKIAFQVIDNDGQVRVRSESALKVRFLPLEHGFGNAVIDGTRWRVFALPLGGDGRIVQVGQRLDIREELERRIAVKTVQKSMYGLPLLILLTWLVVGVGLRPLQRLTAEIEGRSDPSRLGPVMLPGMTRDLRPIVAALNSLFARLSAAWQRERRFIDEAAHELRTSLAAIQLHAESLAVATDSADKQARLNALLAASARGSRLSSQLLTLARVESNEAGIERRPVVLGPLLREEVAQLSPLAERDGIALSVDTPPSLPRVWADPDLLALLVRNLVDNAIRHSPREGAVDIAAHAADAEVAVTVDDQGPGIAPAERERMLERFVGAEGGEGSGLGLAIVARIAEQHGTRVELLDNPSGHGLRVRVYLAVATVD